MRSRPPNIDTAHQKGLRSIAAVEITKGLLVIAGAIALIIMIRRDVNLQGAAAALLAFLHIDPDRRLSEGLVNAAGRFSEMRVSIIAGAAALYSGLRFIEGYGLWRARVWAEWMALFSGGVYLPFEVYALVRHPTWLHWTFLVTNIVVVAYIAYVRISAHRAPLRTWKPETERAA